MSIRIFDFRKTVLHVAKYLSLSLHVVACSKRSDSGERCGGYYLNAWNRLTCCAHKLKLILNSSPTFTNFF